MLIRRLTEKTKSRSFVWFFSSAALIKLSLFYYAKNKAERSFLWSIYVFYNIYICFLKACIIFHHYVLKSPSKCPIQKYAWSNILRNISNRWKLLALNRRRIETINLSDAYLPSAWQTPNFHVLSSSIPAAFAWTVFRAHIYTHIHVCIHVGKCAFMLVYFINYIVP